MQINESPEQSEKRISVRRGASGMIRRGGFGSSTRRPTISTKLAAWTATAQRRRAITLQTPPPAARKLLPQPLSSPATMTRGTFIQRSLRKNKPQPSRLGLTSLEISGAFRHLAQLRGDLSPRKVFAPVPGGH